MERERVDRDALQEYDGASLRSGEQRDGERLGSGMWALGTADYTKRGLGQRSRNHVCISSESNRKPQ